MKDKMGVVYIITNRHNGILYTGVTSNLTRRIYAHKHKLVESFSSKHFVDKLVYWEGPLPIYDAIKREKQLKKWRRLWKIKLIEKKNPRWHDLYRQIYCPFGGAYN